MRISKRTGFVHGVFHDGDIWGSRVFSHWELRPTTDIVAGIIRVRLDPAVQNMSAQGLAESGIIE